MRGRVREVLAVQLVDGSGNVVSDLTLPETEVNGQGSMVAQREAIAEQMIEEGRG